MGKVRKNVKENWMEIFVCSFCFCCGVLLIFFWPCVWDHVLVKQLQLKPGTLIYKFWNTPPQPLYIDIYFFNWTNPLELNDNSKKPTFKEIGPYRFQEFPAKANVTFHDNNATVSYRKQSRYIFLPEQSKGQLTDVITSINVVALSSANQARTWNIFKVKGVEVSLAFFDQQVYLSKTADELLFKGYDDPIISFAKDIAKIMGIDVPFDRFGWFYMRNESSLLTGNFNAQTGTDDIAKLGKINTWNFAPRTDFFSDTCGSLEGASAGELFPPHITDNNNQVISIFSPEMCRNVLLDFEDEMKVHGLTGKKYSGGQRTIDNGTKYPENQCFCSGECVPSGVINVTSCRLGAPVFMSYPHFYDADPYYHQQVEGMTPSKEKHQFYIVLEPKTSLPLEIKGRFQLNVLMSPIKNIGMYKNVPRKFLPVVWFEQTFKVDENIALLMRLVLSIELFGQLLGLLISLISLFWLVRKMMNQQDKKKTDESQERNSIKIKRLPENSPLINEHNNNNIKITKD